MTQLVKPTHNEWQAQIVQAAHIFGWKHLHVRKSIGKGKKWTTTTNIVGWPDLLLWHDKHGFAAIEVKVRPDTAKPEQIDALLSLRSAGARVLVAYPEDWPAVEKLLRGHHDNDDEADLASSHLDDTSRGGR